MGYTTKFYGKFEFNKPISYELASYLNSFSSVRHIKRSNFRIMEEYPRWHNMCFHGKLGIEGEYFVAECDYHGDKSILDYNEPSRKQPGLWCQWIISDDHSYLLWDGCEKFYNYVEWLDYIISSFIVPDEEKYLLNGNVLWAGEDFDDSGVISIKDNEISVYYDLHLFEKDFGPEELYRLNGLDAELDYT